MRGLEVPSQVVEELGGGKRPPVVITINGHSWRSRVAIMRGRHLLGLSNANRKAAGVTTGDEIEVGLELDPEPRVVVEPADFARALDSDPAARAAYDHLAQSNKRQHVHSIESAKTPETRTRRIEQALATLRAQDACRTSERSTMSTVARKGKQQSGKSATKKQGFTAEEKAAMKARAKELKAAEDGESAVRAALAAMPPSDRAIGERLHALIKDSAPELTPKTWYGMPAYAKDGKVVCFFRNSSKFKERYAMFGFNDAANLDQGTMWPVAYALKQLTAGDETKIRALVTKAVR
jgi:uncharacterized protein YdhG (YjbR/CyaY superfamily)